MGGEAPNSVPSEEFSSGHTELSPGDTELKPRGTELNPGGIELSPRHRIECQGTKQCKKHGFQGSPGGCDVLQRAKE